MTKIKYQSLKIGDIQLSSGLFIGTNIQKGRQSKKFINEGFGAVRGKNSEVTRNVGSVNIHHKN